MALPAGVPDDIKAEFKKYEKWLKDPRLPFVKANWKNSDLSGVVKCLESEVNVKRKDRPCRAIGRIGVVLSKSESVGIFFQMESGIDFTQRVKEMAAKYQLDEKTKWPEVDVLMYIVECADITADSLLRAFLNTSALSILPMKKLIELGVKA